MHRFVIKGIGKEVLPVTVAANALWFRISKMTQFFMDKDNYAAPHAAGLSASSASG